MKVASGYGLGKKNKQKTTDSAFILYNVFWHSKACTREKHHMTAEDGVYLQYMILKVKVEMGIESWLSAIIWALEPNSEKFFRRVTFGHRGLVSPDFFFFLSKRDRLL